MVLNLLAWTQGAGVDPHMTLTYNPIRLATVPPPLPLMYQEVKRQTLLAGQIALWQAVQPSEIRIDYAYPEGPCTQ